MNIYLTRRRILRDNAKAQQKDETSSEPVLPIVNTTPVPMMGTFQYVQRWFGELIEK